MSPRRADFGGSARLAILGAETPAGARLRAVLAEAGFPGKRLELYGASPEGEVVLTEYAGEARLIQAPHPAEVGRHDVVFLCERGRAAEALAADAGTRAVLVDLVGAARGVRGRARVHAVPSPLGLLLADLLRPVHTAVGVREATALVLRPAADFGRSGLDELRDQTVRLLSFAAPPREVFGRQLAFNLIPQDLIPGEPPDLDAALAAEVAGLLGWPASRLSVAAVAVPVFHGHAVWVRVTPERPDGEPALTAVTAALEAAPGVAAPSPAAAQTPLDVAEERRIDVARVWPDGLGGYWLRATAGEADVAPAEHALRTAMSVADL